MSRDRWAVWAGVFAVGLLTLVPIGAAGGDSPPTFSAGARSVRVPVTVLDKSGQPVLDLGQEAFRVSDDGRKQPVTLFSHERRPLRIALALDVSRSMADKIREVEEALRHFTELLEPADQILVLTFNDYVRVLQDFTSDRDLLGHVLDMLEPSGGTALYDAAFEAIQRVKEGPAESKAVVLVTDGVDTASSIAFKDLREAARRAEVPVFSIGLDMDSPLRDLKRAPRRGGHGGWPGGGGHRGWPGGGAGPAGFPGGGGPGGGGGWPGGARGGRRQPLAFDARPLADLADDTGALAQVVKELAHYVPGNDEPVGTTHLRVAVETIATILRHRYLIGYDPPQSKPGWRSIRVEVDRPDTTVHARKGYYAGG